MTTKRDSKVARANLWVVREQMKNVAGSAQVRAFKAREIAKQKRDAIARELRAKQAAAKEKAASSKADEAAAEPEPPPSGDSSD